MSMAIPSKLCILFTEVTGHGVTRRITAYVRKTGEVRTCLSYISMAFLISLRGNHPNMEALQLRFSSVFLT